MRQGDAFGVPPNLGLHSRSGMRFDGTPDVVEAWAEEEGTSFPQHPFGALRPASCAPSPPAPRFVEAALGARDLLDRLESEHAVVVPALSAGYRAWLLEEACALSFREARPLVGRGERLVRQRMGVYDDFGPGSRFHDLARHYQALWDGWLASMASCPFESRLVFNDLMLQVYEPGETGITPHMDRSSYRNLICLFVLEGRGRFGVCEDRSGRGARIIPHEPGDVVLTRAPGFRGSDHRPFHFVDRITERRYVFGLRHERGGGR